MTRDIEPTILGDSFAYSLPDLYGKTVSSTDQEFAGRVVLVDIWGTWCPPCRESIPYLETLHDEFEREGLVVVGIAFEEETGAEARRKALQVFVSDHGIRYQILDGGSLDDFETSLPSFETFQGFPTMVIIGRDGTVRHANTVFVPEELDEIRNEIERALATP